MKLLNKYLTYIYRNRITMILDIILASVFGIAVFYAHILIKKITWLARCFSWPRLGVWAGPDGDGSHKKTHREHIELEVTVEAIGERRQIARGVFCQIKGMISTTQAGLEIAQYSVDPKEFWHVFGYLVWKLLRIQIIAFLGKWCFKAIIFAVAGRSWWLKPN